MKHIFSLFFAALLAFAQTPPGGGKVAAVIGPRGASTPATCSFGQVYNTPTALNWCNQAGAWQSLGASVATTTASVQIAVLAPTAPTVAGDGAAYFVVPSTMNGAILTGVVATVITAGTTNTTTIQIHNLTDTVDMLSTRITIDSTETSSATAGIPAVIDSTKDDVATNDVLRIDIDTISTTPATGLIITLTFTLA